MQDKSFYQEFADGVKIFFNEQLKIDISGNLFTALEVISWISILFIIDFVIRKVLISIIRKIVNRTNIIWLKSFYRNDAFVAIIHILPLSFASKMNPILFKGEGPIYYLIQRSTELALLIVLTQLVFRIINTIIDVYNEENSYTTVGVRTFGQMMKFVITFFAILSGVMILFTVNPATIITVLGAMTAAVLLIFRDAIFGFVSGLQIAYSKVIKIGDWVTLSKGNVEGIVREININLVRIEKFDKTIATIPTVDVVTSQVTNHMPMMASGTRQIKRAISFNVNSFQFCSEEMLNKYENYNLIQNYIINKRKQINDYNKNIAHADIDINGQQLTNIGVFRIYVESYLKKISTISTYDPIIVKQLPVTMEGMPIEINCFAKSSNNSEFERIQSDIFDHLLTASRKFDLQIMQSITITDLKEK
ncbi:mechanosensitive ion channel family protein [Faecalibacter rhinopitheci]|uniref:Mechanosensitive ion channel n=1 Tax=Faecalibacter rhinopitheci TaxID=2779678 RepID=A0A8J7FPL4_9FLAO|nr:mechanosensitive ion channel domain-containing protein [Faecalibacter rhinopitheci]MBF0597054.1 mechanosensitive ion channel [Faecalibacter rhinopitheci]MBQ0147683.1 mechanosensitive ion channel [Candidatus Onthonaster equi]